MMATKETLASLPPLQRRMAEAWLTRFEDAWHAQKLQECMQALPAQSILRRPLLLAMIERDIAHHWQDGRASLVESYLHDYPELGSIDEIPIELIAAEYHLRQKHTGNADLSEFAERFPSRIDDLYVLLKPGLFEAQPKEAAPSAENLLERRLKLLQAPAEGRQGRENADGAEVAPAPAEPSPEASDPARAQPPTASDVDDATAGSVELFEPAEPAHTEATGTVAVQPAESVWLDVEKLGDARPAPKPKSTPDVVLPPQGFGRYVIEKKIEEGSQAALYEARDTQLERRVVVKIPNFPSDRVEAARAIFHREGRAAATVFHPSLCPIYDIGRIDDTDFLVMPFVEGEPLSQVLLRQPVWAPRQAVQLMLKVASAIDVAHRQGVVHRDLRPSHILLTTSEIPVIVGFGRAGRPHRYDDPISAAYVAPELLNDGESGGPRIDVYSIGMILQQLIAGRVPGRAAEPPSDAAPAQVEPSLRAIIRKATSPAPEDRYGSVRDMILELNNYLDAVPSVASMEAPLGHSRMQRLSPSATDGLSDSSNSSMQELRKLSSAVLPSGKPAPVPYTRRRTPWIWYAASAVVGGAVMLTILTLGNKFPREGGANQLPPTNPDKGGGPAKPVDPATANIDDLIRDLIAAGPGRAREDAARRIADRKNPQDHSAIRSRITEDSWPENSTAETNGRSALVLALKFIDRTETILPALEQAASHRSTMNENVRAWAIQEATEFADAEKAEPRWRRILETALLEDPSSKIRKLAARLLRNVEADEKTIEALIRRVKDENWIVDPDEASTSKGRLDESRMEALDTLAFLAEDKIKEALNAAKKSRNPKVRGWAFETFKEKFPDNP